jgi:hypothetical protein
VIARTQPGEKNRTILVRIIYLWPPWPILIGPPRISRADDDPAPFRPLYGHYPSTDKAAELAETPVSKIKHGERSPDPTVRKEAHFADNPRHWNHKG